MTEYSSTITMAPDSRSLSMGSETCLQSAAMCSIRLVIDGSIAAMGRWVRSMLVVPSVPSSSFCNFRSDWSGDDDDHQAAPGYKRQWCEPAEYDPSDVLGALAWAKQPLQRSLTPSISTFNRSLGSIKVLAEGKIVWVVEKSKLTLGGSCDASRYRRQLWL